MSLLPPREIGDVNLDCNMTMPQDRIVPQTGPMVYGHLVLTSDEVSKQTSWTLLEALLNAKAEELKKSILKHAICHGLCDGMSIPKEFR